MESTRVWSDGPVGDDAGDGALGRLLGGSASGGADRRIVTGALVCRFCDWHEFEVTASECFCVGCCLPIGVQDGDLYESRDGDPYASSDHALWRLEPSAVPVPGTSPDVIRCPAGHDLFQVAAAYTLGEDGPVRRLSVGLRCLVDGALHLFVDDARVVPVVC
ncbi:hypothetical protein OHB11_05455 [Streptomyces zaomyceticus]|uniref:DUF35 domain-containing protein n=1 Tax=Streptomyces zaomyceticus TaxID=68286 RepID=A0ABZ1L661_9ACTN